MTTTTTVRKVRQQYNKNHSTYINALTIDLEDYFHVTAFESLVPHDSWDRIDCRIVDTTNRLLDCLAAAQVKATFFILGWVAERYPRLISSIFSAGHEIGTHSYKHRLVYTQTPNEFREDVRKSIGILENILSHPIRVYRAPSFSITKKSLWALDILAEEGITIDSSIYPIYHDRYGIPGANIHPHCMKLKSGKLWEYPPPVYKLWNIALPVGGGGYLRLYPYWVTKFALQKINEQGKPFVIYLHPWEIDSNQPRFRRTNTITRMRHYLNLHQTEVRLEQLLADFAFATISESLGQHYNFTAWHSNRN